ncbi:hypothetical protein H6G41_33650 [Tolypothrix sp. FACHB-123]|uniref:hypothetical protein n=1 Tax=Tolypothrix sp. FACHB-123 TaxID=2692868 RepID=UPI001683681B|nr:hypothetical protein [Tolypothrix sp. FACHB-123]MBD2359460.1 hypothetical protein [Tolypothrix sp. FACHB-123]
MNSKTIFDIYSEFQAHNTKSNKLILRSVMHRFIAEHWGGKFPSGSKATNDEVFSFLEIIKKIPAAKLEGTMEVLEQEFAKQGIDKGNSKSYKSAYKAFLNWAENNNYLSSNVEEIEANSQVQLFKRNPKGSGTKAKHSYNRPYKNPYALMAVYGRGKSRGELIYKSDYINDKLQEELNLFEKFRKEKYSCTKATVTTEIIYIKRILGWLHRYKDLSLESLSLTSIITFVKLNIPRDKFRDKPSVRG